jgi:hypothetical protein
MSEKKITKSCHDLPLLDFFTLALYLTLLHLSASDFPMLEMLGFNPLVLRLWH